MSVIGRATPFLIGGDFAFSLTSASYAGINVRTSALAAGWNGTSKVICTIGGSTQVYSASEALVISGSFPGGVTLINNGIIYGLGGSGGNGGNAVVGGFGSSGGGGNNGGAGLSVYVAATVYNNGQIWGSGGGGGGGGSCNDPGHTIGYNGEGGGAGATYPTSTGSAGGADTCPYGSNAGGAGGNVSVAGTAGDTPTGDYFALGGGGGAGGNAIGGDANITWPSGRGSVTGAVA